MNNRRKRWGGWDRKYLALLWGESIEEESGYKGTSEWQGGPGKGEKPIAIH